MELSINRLMSQIRQLLTAAGAIALAFGWLTTTEISALTDAILKAAAPVLLLGSIVWSWAAHGKTAIVTAAANLPEVKKIEVGPVDASVQSQDSARELVRATPSEVVMRPTV